MKDNKQSNKEKKMEYDFSWETPIEELILDFCIQMKYMWAKQAAKNTVNKLAP